MPLDAAAEQAPDGRVWSAGWTEPGARQIAGGVGRAKLEGVVAAAADQALALHRVMDDVVGPAVRVVVTGGWRHSAEVMRAKTARFDHSKCRPSTRPARSARRHSPHVPPVAIGPT